MAGESVEDGMRRATLVAVLLAVVVAGVALIAVQGPKAEESGRYSMTRTPNGVVRLDKDTGAMALCSGAEGHWSCQEMNDSQRTLTAEIDRLRAENKSLKKQLDHVDQNLGLNEPGQDAPLKPKFTLPTEQDVDRAFDYLEAMAKKIHERLDRLQEQQERGPGKAL
jgi:chaperonin cofactor prefoldin